MTQEVSQTTNACPADIGTQFFRLAPELLRRFTNTLKAALHGIRNYATFAKDPHVYPGRISLDSLDVVQDVLETLNGIVRRHGAIPVRRFAAPAA